MNRPLLFALVLPVAACRSEPPAPAAPAPASAAPAPAALPTFTDVSAQAGFAFTRSTGRSGRFYYVEQHGGGAAFVDVDGDHWPDIFTVDGGALPGYQGRPPMGNRLFLNQRDGTFRDVTAERVPKAIGYGLGVAVADADGDRDPDVLVLNHGSIQVLRNDGGKFADATAGSGLDGPGWNAGATFADVDGDGVLDLFVGRYVHWTPDINPPCYDHGVRFACTPYMFQPDPARFLLGRPGFKFEDASAAWNVRPAARALGVIAADFDDDQVPEIYVANDEDPNLLFRPKDRVGFVEEGMTRGAAVNADGLVQAGMGVDVGDYDDDGRLDLVVTNFQDEPVALYHNLGKGLFEDVAVRAGLGSTGKTLGFGVLFEDFDDDGHLDLFVANGHVWENVEQMRPGVQHAQRNQLFHNRGDGTFEEVTDRSGEPFGRTAVSRGAIAADFDHDGDMDLLYVELDAPSVLLRNDGGNANAWLELRLEGKAPNTEAIGARVEAQAGGLNQIREVRRNRSFASAGEPEVHFGLGRAETADVEVRWPSGDTARATGLSARKRYVWTEGDPAPHPE